MTSVREYFNKPHGNMRMERVNFSLGRDYLKKTLQESARKNLENAAD